MPGSVRLDARNLWPDTPSSRRTKIAGECQLGLPRFNCKGSVLKSAGVLEDREEETLPDRNISMSGYVIHAIGPTDTVTKPSTG